MAQVRESIEIDAPPDAVWALVGDSDRIGEWVPFLAGSSAENGERSCTTADGAEIRERALDRSDEGLYYTHEITSSPFPVRSYVSRLSVHGHDGHTHVDWATEFEREARSTMTTCKPPSAGCTRTASSRSASA